MNARHLGYLSLAIVLAASLINCSKKGSPTEPTPVCTYSISPGAFTISKDGERARSRSPPAPTAPGPRRRTRTGSPSRLERVASGPGTVTYSVSANGATTLRTGSLTVAGQTHAVTQEARTATVCSYDLSATGAEFNKDGGSGTFTVTAPADCTWTASSNVPWLVISSGAQGSVLLRCRIRSRAIPRLPSEVAQSLSRIAGSRSGNPAMSVRVSTAEPGRLHSMHAGGNRHGDDRHRDQLPLDRRLEFRMARRAERVVGHRLRNCSDFLYGELRRPARGYRHAAVADTGRGAEHPRGAGRMPLRREPDGDGLHRFGWPRHVQRASTERSDHLRRGDAGSLYLDGAILNASWIVITSSMPRAGDNPVAFTVAANDATTARVGTIVVRDKVVTITQAGK